MLLRHSFFYLIARGAPGVISFAALVLYTRLLSTEEFGRYALALSIVGLVQVLVFQWLHLVLARFLLEKNGESNGVLASILAIFFSLSSALILLGIGAALIWPDSPMTPLIALIIPLSIASGWMEICLKLASVRLQPGLYGRMLTGKNAISLISTCVFIWAGLAATAPLAGLIIGIALTWIFFGRQTWKGINPVWPRTPILREYATYGLPLAITFALGWVISSSDRIIISWILNEAATGAYAAGYDLAQQSLGLLLVIINTAAYPLVIRALNQNGRIAAERQLAINGELMITVAMVSAAGMIALSPFVVNTVIGADFRPAAAQVVPWIAASAAIAGIKAFHLDVAFQLAKAPKWQVYTAAISALMNVALNFLLIPILGLQGAAIATLISLSAACLLSWLIGRRVFPVPPMSPSFMRAGIVSAATYFSAHSVGWFVTDRFAALGLGLLTGFLVAILVGVFVNICGIRDEIVERLPQRKH